MEHNGSLATQYIYKLRKPTTKKAQNSKGNKKEMYASDSLNAVALSSAKNTLMYYDPSLTPLDSDFEDDHEEEDAMYKGNIVVSTLFHTKSD